MRTNLILLLLIVFEFSCHNKQAADEADAAAEEVQTPVTVTTISTEPLTDYIELNATSTYLQSNIIKASANGYIKYVGLHIGQFVNVGQLAFTLKTKEAEALGNTINSLDSSFNFSGLIKIKTNHYGYVAQLDHQAGDYVQDGEQLAVLSDAKSFGFLLNLPYEYRTLLLSNKTVEIILPDGRHLNGSVSSVMPTIDSSSQTQAIMIRVNSATSLPSNLIAKVRLLKGAKTGAPSLPKEALLTDETQENFWIMKMIDTVTAVKVPVIKGMETSSRVEIIGPALTASDKILVKGNYGLPDTAKVKIVKE
jgi:hypothetical protein